ncbi:MAG: hypothetical protein L0Z50_09235 [Verrucomicrobiales bacterium]|nr:hypothetical protein [Verrucomicrobiales bacterium]
MLALRFTLPLAISIVVTLTAAQGPPQRDPQALALLQQSFVTMGGTVPTDLKAIGRITIEAGGSTETGTIRLLARGLDQTAEETDIGGSLKNVTFSRGFAKHREREADKQASLELAVTSQSASLPLQIIAAALSDPETAFEYVGVEKISGAEVHHIRFWKTFDSKPKLQHLAEFSRRDIWVLAASGLPTQLSYVQRDAAGAADRFRYDVTYSDFRNVGGILQPFRIQNSLNGTPWATIEIDEVTLHNGLAESDFAIR